jgi:hypothetical protein
MNMSRCIQGYSNLLSMDITPSECFAIHELSAPLGTPLANVENALAGVQGTMYPLVAARELSVVTSEYVESAVFYTDGSLIEESAGFGFEFILSSPAGVFSAEPSALFLAL